MCLDKENNPFLVGITSWGKGNDKDLTNDPGVFTHVLKYRNWINEVINETEELPTMRSDSMKLAVPCLTFITLIL